MRSKKRVMAAAMMTDKRERTMLLRPKEAKELVETVTKETTRKNSTVKTMTTVERD